MEKFSISEIVRERLRSELNSDGLQDLKNMDYPLVQWYWQQREKVADVSLAVVEILTDGRDDIKLIPFVNDALLSLNCPVVSADIGYFLNIARELIRQEAALKKEIINAEITDINLEIAQLEEKRNSLLKKRMGLFMDRIDINNMSAKIEKKALTRGCEEVWGHEFTEWENQFPESTAMVRVCEICGFKEYRSKETELIKKQNN